MDVIGFLSDLVSEGLDAALWERSPNPEDLLFQRQGDRLELAVEARIPGKLRELTNLGCIIDCADSIVQIHCNWLSGLTTIIRVLA